MSWPSGSLRSAKKVQLHHGNLAAFVKFEIRDFKHWRSFSRPRSSARQLNNDLLGVRIQDDGCNFGLVSVAGPRSQKRMSSGQKSVFQLQMATIGTVWAGPVNYLSRPLSNNFRLNCASADIRNFCSTRMTHTRIPCVSPFVHFFSPLGFRAISS
jgi:hypothetical protein